TLVRVRGRAIQVRQQLALAEGSLLDEDERLIAHGSTLCLMQPDAAPRDAAPAAAGAFRYPENGQDAPDPWKRPAVGAVVEQSVWEERPGIEVLRALVAGELPAPPVHHLIGIKLTAAEPGSAEFTMPASEWLCAPARSRVQGGAVALLAESALSAAIQTTLPAAAALAPIDLKVNYLRPLRADGREASASGEVIHTGRRVAVASATVCDADGRKVAVATGSAMVLAGRPASLGAAEA